MTIQEQILQIRAQLNLSQEKLAKQLNVSFATVNRWEHGHTVPTSKTLAMIDIFCKENGISFKGVKKNV